MKYTDDYINDMEIRKALLKQLYSEKKNLKIIEELDVNAAIVDIATIDEDYFCGYEIKSDKDTLSRLPRQMQIYNYVFDKIIIVVGKSKFLKVDKTVPDFWGILMAEKINDKIILTQKRNPELNKDININWLSKKLWKSDIVNILKIKNLYKGQSYRYRDSLLKILIDNTSLNELKSHIRNVLINRFYDRCSINHPEKLKQEYIDMTNKRIRKIPELLF